MGTVPPKGRADYLELGDWNATCAMCGRKGKASEMVKLPAGIPQGGNQYVHPEHYIKRNPQDFVRGVPDNMATPWSQPQIDAFVIGDFFITEQSPDNDFDYLLADNLQPLTTED